jgi:uncharacterized MAPEG superfamily protein
VIVTLALLTTGALVFLSAAVQHLNTVGSKGLAFVFTDRATPLSREGFAGRAARTLQNNLESSAMVIPPLAILAFYEVSSAPVLAAAAVYPIVRVGFTISYWAGVSHLRSLFWGFGMAMIAILTVNAGLALLTA